MHAIKTDSEKVADDLTINATPHQLVGTDREYMIPADEPYVELSVIDSEYNVHCFEDHDRDGTITYVGPDDSPPANVLLAVEDNTEYTVVR